MTNEERNIEDILIEAIGDPEPEEAQPEPEPKKKVTARKAIKMSQTEKLRKFDAFNRMANRSRIATTMYADTDLIQWFKTAYPRFGFRSYGEMAENCMEMGARELGYDGREL